MPAISNQEVVQYKPEISHDTLIFVARHIGHDIVKRARFDRAVSRNATYGYESITLVARRAIVTAEVESACRVLDDILPIHDSENNRLGWEAVITAWVNKSGEFPEKISDATGVI